MVKRSRSLLRIPVADALHEAAAAFRRGEWATAERLCRQILAAAGDTFDALHLLGIVHLRAGRPAEAVAPLRKALKQVPQSWEVNHHLGLALIQTGRLDGAAVVLAQAVAAPDASPEVWENYATLLLNLHRYDDSLNAVAHVAARGSLSRAMQMVRADALLASGRAPEAIAAFDAILTAEPLALDALAHRGVAKFIAERPAEALVDLDAVLQRTPRHVEALYNRGQCLAALARLDEAMAAYRQTLAADPDHVSAAIDLTELKMRFADWAQFDVDAERLRSLVDRGHTVQSYLFATLWDDPKRLHACARRFAAARLPAQVAPLLPRAAPEAEPLGVAYVGGDFHDHPIAALLAEVMARHDRSRFRVITASYGPDDPTPQRAAIAAACDRFLDVRTMSDRDAAIAIQAAGADIALDVSGMTLHGRPGILAHRPAPVQIAYLANPGTVGAAHLDYFLSDSFVTPPGAERHFSEQVIRVPPSLFPPDPRAIIVPDPPSRAECGLPEEGFVFCCFNAVNKITPAAYDTWMRILGAVDRSVLWLRADLAAARDNLRREADRRGVDPGRILFAARAAHDRHVARHRCADLFLDTFPYNAGSTAVTAVGAGLPVLTCAGKSYAARMGGSVLEAIGLGELIADSLEAYAALAIALARDPGRLAAVKARLSHSRATAPFFDPVALCRRLEDVYTSLARRRVASRGGGPPR